MKVYQRVAILLDAIENCRKSGNAEWERRHVKRIEEIAARCLPHGSGFDVGCKILVEESSPDNILILAPFHKMDEYGYYDGWEEYVVRVTPSLAFGFNLNPEEGDEDDDTLEYVLEVLNSALEQEAPEI